MTEREDWLDERLRNGRPLHSAPAGFTDRVMSKLPEGLPPAPVKIRRDSSPERPHLWLRIAMGTAVIAIGAVLAFEFLSPQRAFVEQTPVTNPGPESEVASVNSVSSAPGSAMAVASSLPLPKLSAEQIQALSLQLDEPLEKELKNVISDTRVAIQFVASNFLPEK
jgi:hypothetical protein